MADLPTSRVVSRTGTPRPWRLVSPRRWRRAGTRSSPWAIPATYAATAIAAGLTFPRLEAALLPGLPNTLSVSAAAAIYSSIASGMLALTGIVFSLTIVMVQFSATAYSPRLVLWVARDPVISHALGVFTATFLYAIAALAWVDRGANGRVLFVSAMFVVVLLVASVFVFVSMLQRIALLQINRMLSFTGDRGRQVIDTTYPPLEGRSGTAALPSLAGRAQSLIYRGQPRAMQAVDVAALVALARKAGGIIELTTAVGDTAVESIELLRIVGARAPIDERRLLDAIYLGEERTFDQDPKYAIRLLVDIAIRALSPAVNDPTTGVQALDQIGDLLYRLGGRRLEISVFHDDDGHPRLVLPSPTWDDFLELAFDEIRAYGAESVQITRRMSALIGDLLAAVPEERRPALAYWQERLRATVARHFADPGEQAYALAEDRQGLGAPRRRPVRG
ncbi:MAG: hypothetical protein H6Q10_576 [Acidobacteria bacterium]|nr:hypothetical protein [Acidobacteriota bacterium]